MLARADVLKILCGEQRERGMRSIPRLLIERSQRAEQYQRVSRACTGGQRKEQTNRHERKTGKDQGGGAAAD